MYKCTGRPLARWTITGSGGSFGARQPGRETIYQVLIEADLMLVIDALSHLRTGMRTGQCSGHRLQTGATTTAGTWS